MARRSLSKNFVRIHPGPLLAGRLAAVLLMTAGFALLGLSIFKPQAVTSARMRSADIFTPALTLINQPIEKAAGFVRGLSGLASLQAENERLEQENAQLRDWYHKALTLEEQNTALRNLLHYTGEPSYRFISSYVIADAGNAYVKSLLIPIGEKDGIKKGQAVLSADGFIGRIVETGHNAARILLITDINSRVPVAIEGTGHHAILAGSNESLPVLAHLPPGAESEIPDGARIVTSGHGGLFPPHLPIGRVMTRENGRTLVKPFAPMGRIMNVKILDSSLDPNLRRGDLGNE